MGKMLSPVLASLGPADHEPRGSIGHWCAGCQEVHAIACDEPRHNGARWKFSGAFDKPTVEPSVHIKVGPAPSSGKTYVCHYFLRDGMLQYLTDSTHGLGGQTLPLVPIPSHAISALHSAEAVRGERLEGSARGGEVRPGNPARSPI